MLWIKNPETEPEIFINDFMGGIAGELHNQEYLRKKFKAGYCYYFAKMLQTAFGRGTVCWTAPFGHFVWVDTDKSAYDIEGKYRMQDHETFYLIPEQFLGNAVSEFLHTPESIKKKPTTKQELIDIVKNYCNVSGEEYFTDIEDWFE